MRAAAGASRDRKGYGALILIFVIGGLAITGILLLPSLTPKADQRKNAAEEAMLATLAEGFQAYVLKQQVIPGTSTWATSIALFTGLNVTQVSCVFPAFPTDTSVQRAFVVDDYLGGSSPLLPYTQSTNGLTGVQTNLLNSRARAMIVSSTKRGLALPVSTGFITQTNFDAIWNWAYNPSTEAPPSGWSSTWADRGEFLHVTHLFLPSLFSTITLQNLKYGAGRSNLLTTVVGSQTNFSFLNGTPLALATTAGTLKQSHVVRGDASFNFGSPSGPVIWWRILETSGTVATNSGTLATAGAGTYQNTPTFSTAGPRSPTYPGYDVGNTAVSLNGTDEWIQGPVGALNNVSGFTIAGWFYPSSSGTNDDDLFGQIDIAGLQLNLGVLQLKIGLSFSLDYNYPYAASTWHHLAGVGDGTTAYLYVDGVQVTNRAYAPASYGSNSYRFNAGANVFYGTVAGADYCNGRLDEVIAYTRALSASEISQLYTNNPP